MLPELPVYNISQVFDVQGALDVSLLIKAIKTVLVSHAGLVVRFYERDGQITQVPDREAVNDGQFIEYHAELNERAAAVDFIAARLAQPFDLLAELPLRVLIVSSGGGHLVCFGVHHIVYDGWSSALLFDEIETLYRDLCQGGASSLPAPPASYSQYVAWQQDAVQQRSAEMHSQYWQRYLDGVTPCLELALNQRRGKVFDYRGASAIFDIPDDIYQAAAGVARHYKVTLFSVLLTVLSVLLQRYSRQQQFCIGYPSANRNMPNADGIIGMFTNTLVYRNNHNKDDIFSDAIAAVYQDIINAQEHEAIQFEKIFEALNIRRDSAYNPLFQVVFLLQDRRAGSLQLNGTQVRQVLMPADTAKFDLNLTIDIDESGARGIIEFATSVFEAGEVAQLWQHYLQLLGDFCAQPGQPISQPVLSAAPSVAAVPLTVVPVQGGEEMPALHQWFERSAHLYPDAVAVECGAMCISYRDLNFQADRLCRRLVRGGAAVGGMVGLSLPRGIDLIVGMLAILKAGCGYLPLDPGYPAERLQYMLDDSGCRLVIVADETGPQFGAGVQRIVLNQPGAEDEGGDPPVVPADPERVAYSIYTSGSTGRPKGVLVSHRNVMRLFTQTEHWFGFSQRDVWTLFHSYSFDFSVWEIFGALLYGGRLVVVPYDVSRSPQDFRQLLKEKGVTILNQTPSAFQQLSLVETADYAPGDRLSALRCVIFGGEALTLQSLAPWVARYGSDQPQLINMYGITETTVHVTYRRITQADIASQTRSLIGEPIPDLSLHLFDEGGNPVPVGMVGEIHVGGPGVALGYHSREQLNRERFITKVLADGLPHRLYRSGDLAKRHADGELEYIGRIDHQVKVRGHRIEIGEIEASLLLLPEVAQAAVLVKSDGKGLERLVAYLVPARGVAAPDGLAIKQALSASLPAFMIPQDIVLVERIPLTHNGKVAKDELLALALPEARASDTYEAAHTPLQVAILAAWQDVLERRDIGIHDNFFAIGGDSIRAVMVAQRCKQHGIAVGVIDILNYQTISVLAMHVNQDHAAGRAAGMPLAPLPPSPARDALLARLGVGQAVYAVSAMQAHVFDHYRCYAGDGQGVFHVQQSYRFRDPQPDSGAMARAITRLVQAHPVLRTLVLCTDDGEWLQTTAASLDVPLAVYDLRKFDAAAQEQWIAGFIQQDRRLPFRHNAPDAPLLRFSWFALSDTCFELCMSIHHGIDDGWGNQLFLSQLFDLYLALRDGQPVQFAQQENVLLEYIALEQHNAGNAEHIAFWASQAAEARAQHPSHMAGAPGKRNLPLEGWIPHDVSNALVQAAMAHQVTLRALLIAVLNKSLQRALGRPCQVMGVVMNGRKESLSDPLESLGLFWNMLPLVCSGGSEAGDMHACHRKLIEMEKFSAYPLHRIGAADGPLSQPEVTFNYVNFHNQTAYGGTGQLQLMRKYGHDKFHYPINVFVSLEKDSGQLYLKIESDGMRYGRAAVQGVMDAYMADLRRAALDLAPPQKAAA
ncbi:non-ribosomal peptide synthetase [Pseudoduganella ginsengisoli]